MFLDSDDYLIEGCLKRLEAQTFQDVQEICGNYLTKGSKQLQVKSALVKPEELITMILDPVNHQTLPDFYHLECATLLGVWGKLFLREIVERLELPNAVPPHSVGKAGRKTKYLKRSLQILPALNKCIFQIHVFSKVILPLFPVLCILL